MRARLNTTCSLLAVVLACVSSAGAAQDTDAVARLRARVSAAPSDVSLQCQLSFALVGASQFDEARTTAARAIDAVPRPLTPASHRLLGACLYNLGRAEEGLGHRREAATAYVRSLAVRGNPSVSERLRALVPETPEHHEAAALVLFAGSEHEPVHALQDFASVSTRGDSLLFVTAEISYTGGYTGLAAFVVATREDRVVVARIDEWSQEDNGARMDVEEPSTIASAQGTLAAAVAVAASGGGACHRMDGFMDFEHHATILVSFDGTHVRSRALVTQQSDCAGHQSMALTVRGANVVITRSRHGELAVGTHPIEDLLR